MDEFPYFQSWRNAIIHSSEHIKRDRIWRILGQIHTTSQQIKLPNFLEKQKLTTGERNLTTLDAAKTSEACSKDYTQEETE